MAFLDRVLADLPVRAYQYDGTVVKDYAASTTPTYTTPIYVDPLSSGGVKAMLFDTAAGGLTVTTPDPGGNKEITLTYEFVLEIPIITSGTVDLCYLGAAAGLLLIIEPRDMATLSLPFNGYTGRKITFNIPHGQANHVVISMSLNKAKVYVNGERVVDITPELDLVKSGTSAWFTLVDCVFATGSTNPYVLDTFAIYTYELSESQVRRHYLECFWQPNIDNYITSLGGYYAKIDPNLQNTVISHTYPDMLPLEDFKLTNCTIENNKVKLNVKAPERYDPVATCYRIDDISTMTGNSEGTIHMYFNYVSASHANKGVFYMRKNDTGVEYEMFITSGNVVQFKIWNPTFDGTGLLTGYTATTYTGPTLSNGNIGIGINWDFEKIYFYAADTLYQTITHAFNPFNYTIWLGNSRAMNQVMTADYELRLWNKRPTANTTTSTRGEYGNHMWNKALISQYKVPVYVTGQMDIEIPLGLSISEIVYSPTLEIEGGGIVTDTLIT